MRTCSCSTAPTRCPTTPVRRGLVSSVCCGFVRRGAAVIVVHADIQEGRQAAAASSCAATRARPQRQCPRGRVCARRSAAPARASTRSQTRAAGRGRFARRAHALGPCACPPTQCAAPARASTRSQSSGGAHFARRARGLVRARVVTRSAGGRGVDAGRASGGRADARAAPGRAAGAHRRPQPAAAGGRRQRAARHDRVGPLPPGERGVWVGLLSPSQLPPVGAGSVLHDMIASGLFPQVRGLLVWVMRS